MLTDKFFLLWNNTFKFGNSIRLITLKWDSSHHRLRTLSSTNVYEKKEKLAAQAHIMINILLRIWISSYYICTLCTVELTSPEIVISSCAISIWVLSSTILFLLLIPTLLNAIVHVGNRFFIFNEYQMEFHGMNKIQKQEPGIENPDLIPRLIVIGVKFAIACVVLTFPTFLFFLGIDDWKLFWLFHRLSFPGASVLVAIIATYVYGGDAYAILIMGEAITMYSINTHFWLGKNICSGPETSIERKEKLQILCRAHHVQHRAIEELIYYLVPTFGGIGVVVSICMIYAVIGAYHVLNIFVLGCCATIAFVAIGSMKMLSKMGCIWSEQSKAYSKSFQENDVHYTMLDQKFFKSVRPIVFHIGEWMTVDERLFPNVMNFIADWVINLLLSEE